jgi:hypothetical protein
MERQTENKWKGVEGGDTEWDDSEKVRENEITKERVREKKCTKGEGEREKERETGDVKWEGGTKK